MMNSNICSVIDRAKETVISGGYPDRRTLMEFLELDPYSNECEYLGRAARDIARISGNNIARVSSSIGVDLAPCSMSCKFCSLGEKWGLITETYTMSDDDIIRLIQEQVDKGYFQFTLRTTEFYCIDALCSTARKLKDRIKGRFRLSVNTGELTDEEAKRLHDAGFSGMYHTVRLREGEDTPILPSKRIETINAVKHAGMLVSCGLDPIGVEHTNNEILDRLELFRTLEPVGVCVMRRINVKGTPMEGLSEISDERMAQLVAVTRMSSGGKWNVSVHPPIKRAVEFGANNVTVETGANPRRNCHEKYQWKIFDQDTAKCMLTDAGYDIIMNPFTLKDETTEISKCN